MTPKWEDTEEIVAQAPTPTWDDTEEVSSSPVEEALPELGRAEAGAISFGQGASLGLTPILSGIVGAGTNAVEQAGDALGLSTDAELESKGFTLPDKKKGLEGLMDAYYASRDAQKKHQDAAHEQYPVQSIVANIAGSIPTTIATAGVGGPAGAILPKAANLSKAGTAAKIMAGAKEGAKAGTLVGFGNGDAKLGEGEIAKTINETGSSAIGGGLVGGAIPGAIEFGKGVTNYAGTLPIVNELKTAFKGGRFGLDLSEKSANQGIKTFSEDLLKEIRSQFTKAGLTKANALEYADEVGIRINAGEHVDEVVDDLISRGAIPDDIAEKTKFLNMLKYLKDGPEDKLGNKLDIARAKQIQKMNAKGYDLLDESTENAHIDDLVPGTDADAKLGMTKQTFQKIGQEEVGDGIESAVVESKPVVKLIQQAEKALGLDLKKYDLNNLTLREVNEIIGYVNNYSGVANVKGPSSPLEKMAAGLAKNLRELSEEALEEAGQKSGNKSLHKIFAATDRAGIKGNLLTSGEIPQNEMIDNLRDTVTAGDSKNRERMFQYLNDVDSDTFGKYEQGADFLNEFNDVAKQNKPLNSSSKLGLFGSAKNMVNQVSNAAGKKYESFSKLASAPKEHLEQIAKIISGNADKAKQSYASPILKAASAKNERQKSAILYGLYQQPAFRELYQSLGESLTPQLDETANKAGNQARDLLLNNDEEN